MKIIQYAKEMVQKRSVPYLFMGIVLVFLTVAVVHQTKRLNQLEKDSFGAKVFLSRRSAVGKAVPTKPDVAPGAIYTRWGRTVCPDKLSKLVYHGVAGGQYYDHTGGASNILCLPLNPSWGNYTDKEEKGGSRIYGAEYEIAGYDAKSPTGLFSGENIKTKIHNQDVPCAVCQTLTPATIMMLPARLTCYSGWTLEYSGYLMSELQTTKGRTQFTCIDVAPEGDPAGYKNENGLSFNYVQGACGSLPCPPYVQGRELTCAVCSQRQPGP